MSGARRLCALADIPDPGAKGFEPPDGARGRAGFVVRRGREVVGYVDACPHTGQPLPITPDRYLTREGDLILCTGHGALFRISDGLCVAGPCAGRRLTLWPVAVRGEDVVALSTPPD